MPAAYGKANPADSYKKPVGSALCELLQGNWCARPVPTPAPRVAAAWSPDRYQYGGDAGDGILIGYEHLVKSGADQPGRARCD